MQVQLSIWGKLTRLVLTLLFIATLAGVFFWYLPLIQKNQNYRRRLLALESELAQQEKVNRLLKGSIESMQNDPKTVERMAREKLGWSRTNEMVVRFKAAADSTAP